MMRHISTHPPTPPCSWLNDENGMVIIRDELLLKAHSSLFQRWFLWMVTIEHKSIQHADGLTLGVPI